jgi:hypothetical protein
MHSAGPTVSGAESTELGLGIRSGTSRTTARSREWGRGPICKRIGQTRSARAGLRLGRYLCKRRPDLAEKVVLVVGVVVANVVVGIRAPARSGFLVQRFARPPSGPLPAGLGEPLLSPHARECQDASHDHGSRSSCHAASRWALEAGHLAAVAPVVQDREVRDVA